MPNKWVQFVKKWSADNNMNYMCAMTTKECKEAYLKEHPKPEKKAKKAKGTYDTIFLNGGLIWDIQEMLDKVVSQQSWSGSLDDIKAIAKKNKLGIEKYLKKTELATIDSLIKGLENDDKRENVFDFFQDILVMLDGYVRKTEHKGMAEEDVPSPAPDRTKVQKELVDMGKKAMEVADKRANIQMELSEIGKKAKLKETQKEAQDYLASKVPKKVIIRKKKTPKADAPNTDVARFQEAETNPALKVLTNADLLKMIGSFTKGMKPSAKVMIEKASDMKGVRGKLRDAMVEFFKKIYSNPTYIQGEDEVDFGSGKLKLDDIMAMIYAITLQTSKYSQKDLGNTIIELYPTYKKKYSLDHLMSLASKMFNKGMVVVNIDQIDMKGRHYDVEEKIDTPSTIKDSKFRYDGFMADPNA